MLIYICWFDTFKKMCTSFKNQICNGMSSFVRKICFIQEHRRRANNYRQRKNVVGAARFSFHICQYIEEMIVHDLLLFKKHCLDIINEHFWYSLSKQMHSFDYLPYFSYGK